LRPCVAAAEMEIELLAGKLANGEKHKVSGFRFWSGRLGQHETFLLTCGMGPGRVKGVLERFAVLYDPEFIFHLGVCGALSENLQLYRPVLAVDVCASYHSELAPLRLHVPESGVLAALESQLRPEKGRFVTHLRPVFSSGVRRRLVQNFSADCVDMEAWEVARFYQARGIPLTVIKAVSDFADLKSAATFWLHAPKAAQAAQRTVYEMIRSL